MDARGRLQVAEALGPKNRWYCSQFHGRQVEDVELLVRYYIQSGGAVDFARRFEQAQGPLNRWYCSEFYRREISDPETLWQYYMNFAPPGTVRSPSRYEPPASEGDMHFAC